jgi:hypothetical protein
MKSLFLAALALLSTQAFADDKPVAAHEEGHDKADHDKADHDKKADHKDKDHKAADHSSK